MSELSTYGILNTFDLCQKYLTKKINSNLAFAMEGVLLCLVGAVGLVGNATAIAVFPLPSTMSMLSTGSCLTRYSTTAR